jgi:Cell division protein CrgA
MASPRRRSGRTAPRAPEVQAGRGIGRRLPGRKKTNPGRTTERKSGRYTPPVPRAKKVSPRWVPVLMLVFLISGVIVVVINYLGVLPGGASNWYLVLGLGLIAAGFITATQYR